MAQVLTQKEMSARLVRLRNLERLHKRLTKKSRKQREQIGILEAMVEKQKGLIEKLLLPPKLK